MNRIRTSSALLALAMAACAGPLAAQLADVHVAIHPTRPPDAAMFDAAAAAMGLRPLRAVTLGAGEREIRLWPSTSLVIPEFFMRVVDRDGAAAAEMYAYWKDGPVHQDSVFARFEPDLREKAHCGPIQHAGGFGFCVVSTASPEGARALVSYLDSIHAWSAADEDPNDAERASGRMSIQIDGCMLVVEVRRGDRYDDATFFQRHMTPGSASRNLFLLGARF